jgi:hypothetical protein
MPLWVPEWVVTVVGRVTCRLLRWHNVTCRGRADHTVIGAGIIDPQRWDRFPRH